MLSLQRELNTGKPKLPKVSTYMVARFRA